MTNRDLFHKIKKLEKIEPSAAWIDSTRSFVLDYARIQEKKEKRNSFYSSRIDLTNKLNSVFAVFRQKFALQAASFAVILIMAGNFVAAKAAESLPGDNFYPVKLLAEKAELALTFNEDKRVDLKFELVERRLNEFSRLVESGKISANNDSDSESANIAMDGFKNQLSAAVGELDNAAASGSDNSKAVAMAKITDSKTSDYAKKIEKSSISLNMKTKGKITEAINKIEEANINALAVLASANKKSGDSSETSVSKEIAGKVEEKIKNAEEKAKLIEEKVLSVKVAAIGADSSAEPKNSPASKLLEEAKGVLLEAKNDLAGNDPSKALEKIIASNVMSTAAEKMVDTTIANNAADNSSGKTEVMASPSPSASPVPSASPSARPSPQATEGAATPSVSPTASPASTPPAPSKVEGSPEASVSPSPIPAPSVTPTPSAMPASTPSPQNATS